MGFLVSFMYAYFIRSHLTFRAYHGVSEPAFTVVSRIFKVLEGETLVCVTNKLAQMYSTMSSSQTQFNYSMESQPILTLIQQFHFQLISCTTVFAKALGLKFIIMLVYSLLTKLESGIHHMFKNCNCFHHQELIPCPIIMS